MNNKETVGFGQVDNRSDREKFLDMDSIADFMEVELLANPQGVVFMVHHDRMPVIFDWVEYDPAYDQMTFTTYDGDMMHLGLEVPEEMHEFLAKTPVLLMVYEKDGKPYDSYTMPLICHEAVIN